MIVMSLLSVVLFLYVLFSLILPLRLPRGLRVAAALMLLAAAFKNTIFRWISGGLFFAPDLPRWLLLTVSLLYNLLFVGAALLLVKDAAWLLWKVFQRRAGLRPFPSRGAAWCVLVLSEVVSLWGMWEAVRVPDAVCHNVEPAGLSPAFDGLRVAVLTDLHASAINRRPFVQELVERVNALSPDVILLPGDLVDGPRTDRAWDLAPLAELRAPLGVFGVSGNHEYYSGYDEWMDELKGLGVVMLENRHTTLTSGDGQLVVAGVPDEGRTRFGLPPADVAEALEGAPTGATVLLMSHRPDTAPQAAGAGAALQVSGHTHGGQMPLLRQLVARFNNGYVRGWYDVPSSPDASPMKLYVSSGASQWNGLVMRLLTPPEIAVLTLHATPRDQ